MDSAALRKLAFDVSSTDLVTSRDAKTQLKTILTPQQIIALLCVDGARDELDTLLEEVLMVGNEDVLAIISDVMKEVFSSPTAEAMGVLSSPSARFLIDFAVDAMRSPNTAVAASGQKLLTKMMFCLRDNEEASSYIGQSLQAKCTGEVLLRLFNTDAVDADQNSEVCTFLSRYTEFLPVLFEATLEAFDTDPLLLSNYLIVCGLVCRHVDLPSPLYHRLTEELQNHNNLLSYAFVCRFGSILMYCHESNAVLYAPKWLELILNFYAELDEDTMDAAFDLVGASCSTHTGWGIVATSLPVCELEAQLKTTSNTRRLSTLRLLLSMVSSPASSSSYFSKDVLMAAWQLRTAADDGVRLTLWKLIQTVCQSEELGQILAPSCASFLCSGAFEENPIVRELKLRTAAQLEKYSLLPESIRQRLRQVLNKGLYPAGSSGVSLMTRD